MRLIRFWTAFAGQQALSCLFPGFIFVTLAISQSVRVPFLPRYDLILLLCLTMQWGMYRTEMETRDELKVITLFHLIGLCLELYKTHMGSWAYPEAAWTKLAGVPLYSGFMYASVGSYLCQAWRRFHLQLSHWPGVFWVLPLVFGIYLNFFTEHFLPDVRWLLMVLVCVVFFRTQVQYAVLNQRYWMPLSLSFVMIGFFVWVAENIATYYGAWQYPHQHAGWHAVHASKISSWSLLVIISFLLVAHLKQVKERRGHSRMAQMGYDGQRIFRRGSGIGTRGLDTAGVVDTVRGGVRLRGGAGSGLPAPADGDGSRLGLSADLGGEGAPV